MGIRYENLDAETRKHMIAECAIGGHYQSPRLTSAGLQAWPKLMADAAQTHNDDWIAEQILRNNYLKDEGIRTVKGKQSTYRINKPSASQQLAEGEFNRFYLRGLCVRTIAEGGTELEVYRGKEVNEPRPESQAKIGSRVNVHELLAALRSNDFVSIEGYLQIPSGPNSGLTARLVRR